MDKDRVEDRVDTDIEDFGVVVDAKHVVADRDKTVVMAWVDAMVSVVANRQAF